MSDDQKTPGCCDACGGEVDEHGMSKSLRDSDSGETEIDPDDEDATGKGAKLSDLFAAAVKKAGR